MSHDSPTFPPRADKCQTTSSEGNQGTREALGSFFQPMAESQSKRDSSVSLSQRESTTFGLRTAALDRRHSTDGSTSTCSRSSTGQGPSSRDRFHPYHRQLSDGKVTSSGHLMHSRHPCLLEPSSPDTCLVSFTSSSSKHATWDPYVGNFQTTRLTNSQRTYPELPVEPPSLVAATHPSYSPMPPQQVSSSVYTANSDSNRSQYSLQSLSTPTHQDSTTHCLFPKPIYSYSILIFMALKNSKTGSLPVSEIYTFMTEHFPYFKTAPDGWKNSVRHNLSLNKCFEKVENKSGTSSRKGCLWALNPAKVEKMQEELNKWRRKDPISVRKSMARPEDLDRLLGTRSEKHKYVPTHQRTTSSSRLTSSLFLTRPLIQESCSHPIPVRYSTHFPQVPSSSKQLNFFHSTANHPIQFPFHGPCGQLPSSGVPTTISESMLPASGNTPPGYSASLPAEYIGHRNMQELLLEGETVYDIDTLNPSLTDLQLHGNFWDELREDSLAPDSQAVITTALASTSPITIPHLLTSSLHALAPPSQASEVVASGLSKREEVEVVVDDEDPWVNGVYSVACMSVENRAGYLTSLCNTPIYTQTV